MAIDQEYPSKLLEKAVEEFAKLPGVGRKTALRYVLFLLRWDVKEVESFCQAIQTMRKEIKHCEICHNISDSDICPICSDKHRDASEICVVENVRDVLAVENTRQFRGLYHVLGGLISPIEGIGPSDIEIESLVNRVTKEGIREVIFALSATMEGDTTAFYISRKLAFTGVLISAIARGVAIGDEIEWADEVTLGRSITDRVPFGERK